MKNRIRIISILLLLTPIITVADSITIDNASISYTMSPESAKESTQSQILSTEQAILQTNLKALQIQLAEYRNRLDQSASLDGGYKEMAETLKSAKKDIEDVNEKLGNSLMAIGKIREVIEERFGKNTSNLTSTELAKDILATQKKSIQRMYIRMSQLEQEIDNDAKYYNGTTFASRLDEANNPVKAMQLMADTMGGIQRAITSLNQVLIERSLKDEIDKLFEMEQENNDRKKQILASAEIEFWKEKNLRRYKNFQQANLTPAEKKEQEKIEEQKQLQRKQLAKVVQIRLKEAGVQNINDGILDSDNLVNENSSKLDIGSIIDNVLNIKNDGQLSTDLGELVTSSDGDDFTETVKKKIESKLDELYNNSTSSLEGTDVFKINATGSIGGVDIGNIASLVKKAAEYIKNPEKLQKDLKQFAEDAKNKAIAYAKQQGKKYIRQGLKTAKNLYMSQINQGKNILKGELNKITDYPRQQLNEFKRTLREHNIDIDTSDLENHLQQYDPTTNVNNLLDGFTGTVDSVLDNITDKAADGIDGLINNIQ